MKTLSKIVTILLLLILIFFVYKLIENKQPEIIIKTHKIYSDTTIKDLIPIKQIKDSTDNIISSLNKIIDKLEYKTNSLNDSIDILNDLESVIDTVYVYITDYLTLKFYSDTIYNDLTGFCVVNDSIYKNSIKSRQIVRNNIITEKYIQPKGLYFGGGFNTYSNVHIGASYLKNKSIFTIETGTQLMPDNNRGLFVEFDYKRKIFN